MSNLLLRTISTNQLAGSVEYHEHQIFIGTEMTDWPSNLEQTSPEQMNDSNLIRKWKEDIDREPRLRDMVKLHACSAKKDSIFLFPEALYFENPTIEISSPLSILSSTKAGAVPETGIALPKDVYYMFVCTHMGLDQRCGLRGPNIVKAIRKKALEGVHVFECSHLGGHKYAGNLVVYGLRYPSETACPPTPTLSYHGDWYGLIEEADVETLLDYVMNRKTLWKEKWRGSIGLSVERQKQIAQNWGLLREDCSCGDTSCGDRR
jgi:hypothetical protein